MKTSKQRRIGAILSYVSIIASTIIQFLYTPFLVARLGQSEYGLYSLVSSIIGYLTVLDLGFGNAIVVHTAKYRATNETEKENVLLGMFKIIYWIIGIIAAAIGIAVAFNSNSLFGESMSATDVDTMKTMLLILSVNLFLSFSFSVYNSIITASEQFVFQKIVSLAGMIAKPLLMIPILFMGYKSIALCIVITVVNFIILISNYLFCRKRLKINVKFRGFDKKMFRIIFGYSFFIFLAQVVDQVNWHADKFILGMVSGTIAVSVYAAAAQINTMFIHLSTAISGVLLPKVSKMVAKKASSKELTDEMIKVGRIQFYIVFLAASGFVLVGRHFMNAWLGSGFDDSYYVALLLIIPTIFPLIQNTGLAIMQAMNKYKFKALSTFIMAAFNIAISIFLAKMYGAIGAAIGTTIAIVICNIIAINIYYSKSIKLDVLRFWKEIFIITIKLLIPIAITVILISVTEINGWLAVLTYGVFYIIIYSLATYCLAMNTYEKGLIKSLIKKINSVSKLKAKRKNA